MKSLFLIAVVFFSSFILAACSDGPGELKGTWRLEGVMPITVSYREDEEEAMGIISKVSYANEGNHILVTYESGIAEGHTIRFKRIDHDTYHSELGTLKRVR